MKPRKPINRVSKKRRERSGVPGKCGIVRLHGPALEQLRNECLERDNHCCVKCGIYVRDDVPDWAPNKYHMAHIGNKRMHGDVIINVKTLCGCCHTGDKAEHNCGGRPLPRKDGSNV